MLTDIAVRTPVFAGHLQPLAQEANIQTGGLHGEVQVEGESKVYGPAVVVNTGTISGTYTLKDDEPPA